MKKTLQIVLTSFLLFAFGSLSAQVDPGQLGAWYMYFWNTKLGESPFGFQGDKQYRNWNLAGDLEQLLLRGGATYQPANTGATFTLGYAFILTGQFGTSNNTTSESRIYQEALLPQKVGNRFYLTHRFRYEQRFVENQDFRTRYRYNLFLNIPLNQQDLKQGAVYIALYNELFINGQREIGPNRMVEIFDRNRTYGALGYSIADRLRVQAGYMRQTTDALSKGQLQVSLHHRI